MSSVKSIRKCDDKVTASDLGVKEGDKFIVLPRRECFESEHCSMYNHVWDVLVLNYDDGSDTPKFFNHTRQKYCYETFSCLARYEDYYKQREKETEMKQNDDVVLENVKFDMVAIASDLGVSLEEAHKIVQPLLFENGVTWADEAKDVVRFTHATFLFIDTNKWLMWSHNDDTGYKELSVKPQTVYYIKEQPKEIVEFNGKKYNKEDLEKALALLSPVSE